MPQLAHELNGLLDGAMRSLRLAEGRLDESPSVDAIREGGVRLQRARLAMEEMALVLRRAMAGATNGATVFGSDRTIGEEIERVCTTLAPQAEEQGVAISVAIGSEVSTIPAGPLGPVLLNGVRNAIEACADPTVTMRRVEIAVHASPDAHYVTLLVSDTGTGLGTDDDALRFDAATTKLGGHGIGTEVCRSLVEALDGEFSLRNIPFGQGAVMQAHVPVRSLSAP